MAARKRATATAVFSSRPEWLGIVIGIVFLVVTILFQYFNLTADSNVSIFGFCW
ncbi:hypothetical protein CASFOL_025507 [Castilleja foliolosa]|uniref:Photosystem II protein J n=1 Tax=Castilleja foliolosa TaxID=1961234 RepID=A0ABD3CS77_9LAMI